MAYGLPFGISMLSVFIFCSFQCVCAVSSQEDPHNSSAPNRREELSNTKAIRGSEASNAIYCVETVLPNEILCELGSFFSSDRWKELQPLSFGGITFLFNSSSDPSNKCHAIYKPKNTTNPPKRFVHGGVQCKLPGDKTLLKDMKVSDVDKVQLLAHKPDDRLKICVFLHGKSGILTGEVSENGRTYKATLVKYEYELLKCKSLADKSGDANQDTSIFSIFEGMENDNNEPMCFYDGRRCRPVSTNSPSNGEIGPCSVVCPG